MNNIKRIRKERGLTLDDLSIATGISIGYLCHLERGTRKNPSYLIMKRIAVALTKDIADIFR